MCMLLFFVYVFWSSHCDSSKRYSRDICTGLQPSLESTRIQSCEPFTYLAWCCPVCVLSHRGRPRCWSSKTSDPMTLLITHARCRCVMCATLRTSQSPSGSQMLQVRFFVYFFLSLSISPSKSKCTFSLCVLFYFCWDQGNSIVTLLSTIHSTPLCPFISCCSVTLFLRTTFKKEIEIWKTPGKSVFSFFFFPVFPVFFFPPLFFFSSFFVTSHFLNSKAWMFLATCFKPIISYTISPNIQTHLQMKWWHLLYHDSNTGF